MGVRKKKDTMSATEAKNSFGELLDEARTRPIKIEKNGRAVAVVISAEEYKRLELLEDAYWGRKAEEALKEGTVGVKESEKFLSQWLNAKD
jgi:antitoxin Phd